MVVYERFQCKAFTENIFGVLEGWLLMGGGRMWIFHCNEIFEMLDFQSRAEKEAKGRIQRINGTIDNVVGICNSFQLIE